MLLERAYMIARAGTAEAFAEMLEQRAVPLLKGVEGADDVRFGRGVESPDTIMLLIEWASMDAHTAFTKLPVFTEFRALLAPYVIDGSMEHFEMR